MLMQMEQSRLAPMRDFRRSIGARLVANHPEMGVADRKENSEAVNRYSVFDQ